MSVELDKKIPDFEITATNGIKTSFSKFQGNKIVLYFYPRDNTPGCTQESIDFTANYKNFLKNGVIVFGISRDTLASHEKFKAKYDMPFDLIADPEENICNLFGVMKDKNMYGKKVRGIERSTFIINEEGVLIKEWRKVKVPGHVDAVLEYLNL